jgi:very-short-patch-repair endonuclease
MKGGEGMRKNTRRAEAEKRLWEFLRKKRGEGLNFRRGAKIGPYSTAFCCRNCRLIIEIDENSHPLREGAEMARTDYLENEGYRVIRFLESDVAKDPETVFAVVDGVLAALPVEKPSRRQTVSA